MLSSEVEVDEAYIGIRGNGRRGNATIFGAAERGGRVRITHVQSAGSRVLIPKIKQDIRQGSRIYSDSAQVYTTLGNRMYIFNSSFYLLHLP
jgi:hypothetical protein